MALAIAALIFTAPSEPEPIEVSIILDTGNTMAGSAGAGGAQSEQQESGQQAAPSEPQEQASQSPPPPQPAVQPAPRPNPKPAAPRVVTPRPSPPKAAPVATEPPPVVEPTPAPVQPASPPVSTSVADGGVTGSGVASGAGASASAGGSAGASAGSSSGASSGGAAGGGRSGRGASDYLERVRAALAKHKKYPDQARKQKQEGTVSISLHLARDGTVLGVQIAKTSGVPSLDEAALQMARDASPVPRVPDEVDGQSVRIALPVTFSLGFFARF